MLEYVLKNMVFQKKNVMHTISDINDLHLTFATISFFAYEDQVVKEFIMSCSLNYLLLLCYLFTYEF